jgi:hypothetical protein
VAEAIYNDVFGRLTWDGRQGCWLGGIDWPLGSHTEVAIWHAGTDVAAGLRTAAESLDWLMSHERYARRCVAEEMLEVYNHDWRDEPEPITEEDLVRRIELVRVAFGEDGSLLLTYDAGEMFGGHVLDGEFGADRSFRGAGLVG